MTAVWMLRYDDAVSLRVSHDMLCRQGKFGVRPRTLKLEAELSNDHLAKAFEKLLHPGIFVESF